MPERVASLIEAVAERLGNSGLVYGHGTDNAWDEAVYLVVSMLDVADEEASLNLVVEASAAAQVWALAEQRIERRIPLAYLLGRAKYMGLDFHISPQVIVPRSPLGFLLERISQHGCPGRLNGSPMFAQVADVLESLPH